MSVASKQGKATLLRLRARRLRDDESGVSAVIGTIMSLMVFLAFIGMFTNFYLPVWMEENESSHMSVAQTQFIQMKSIMDSQILNNNRNLTMYSPISLGSEGIPVFAESTAGKLELSPQEDVFNIEFVEDDYNNINITSKGRLRLIVPNRYYVRQSVVYSNGALVLWQESGMYMKVRPSFQVTKSAGNVTISHSLISLINNKDQGVPGVGVVGVNTNLLYTDSWTHTWAAANGSITYNLSSVYANAWQGFFNDTLSSAGLNSTDFSLSVTDTDADTRNDRLTITINNIKKYDLNHSFISIFLGGETTRS